jgi:uncharacterized LabA/DUF88 family protein
MTEPRLKLAVFIDFDNVEIGVRNTLNLPFDIGAVLEAIKERGEIVTKVAYSDWKRSGDYARVMAQHAVRLVQRVMTPGGDKNGADINLALDALEMAFTHDHINAFVIVGGDSDFISLVEKLKQYDRKVFVVGGRSFTSQVMQKNCTEFIAYENIVPDRRSGQPRQDRSGAPRGTRAGAQAIEQSAPLVKRALKVLADREVTPQLGLLKSTLLQLDSSFSERDYGAGSFREFADKLAALGLVSLKHQGRSTLVELIEGAEIAAPAAESDSVEAARPAPDPEPSRAGGFAPPPASADADTRRSESSGNGGGARATVSLGEAVAFVRRALADPPNPPRWPMYPRQFKQFLRAADGAFDESRFGSINDLMRACQKDGLLRLERDRQGGLRVFASTTMTPSSVPVGWSRGGAPTAEATTMAEPDALASVVEPAPEPSAAADAETFDVIAESVEAVAQAAPDDVAEAETPRPRRGRARKSPAAATKARRRTAK